MASLSKNTTYRQMLDLIRLESKVFDNPMFSDAFLIKNIDLAISNFYVKQSGRDFYQQRTTYSLSGSSNPYHVDLSSTLPFPYKIVDVVYKGSGRTSIKQVPQSRLEEELQLTNINANSIYCSIGGDAIDFSFGSDITVVTSDSIEVLYQRQPKPFQTYLVDSGLSLTDGLIESYNLNDTTGSYAGLDLTNNTGNVVFSPGKYGNCANFVEARYGEDYLVRESPITQITDNFTICLWANTPVTPTAGSFFFNGLISGAGQNTGWGVGIGGTSTNTADKGKHLIFSYVNTLKNVAFVIFNIEINPGWRFILVERDNGILKGYVDTVVASNTSSVAVSRTPTVRTIVGADAIPVFPGVSSRQPNAQVDMLNVWGKILSSTEKADMWNDGNGNPLLGRGKLDYLDVLDSDVPFIAQQLVGDIKAGQGV